MTSAAIDGFFPESTPVKFIKDGGDDEDDVNFVPMGHIDLNTGEMIVSSSSSE
eukprot:CAMPEP_0204647174 /NCGR_PEP_ID=MMETSP0718-20130828/5696_1 /ASSEMBLY_ACC=CAM_ASM_000674 /TAXON_ID=230516 /ORGANISM="Chaetoceros curvisetus" /LENGTH=52 /DNA_ID=CAMNT_0051669665 /DNA_START=384 /DNA_END=542 /DNA_ORIENTATION=-